MCDCDGAQDGKAHSRTKSCFSASLHLGLLSTCRRIYLEAFPILWSTNTFCFEDGYTMFLTLKSLAPHQTSMIKNVRLDVNHFVRINAWEFDFKNSKLTTLKSLRNITLFIYTHKPYYFLPRLLFRNPHLVNSVRNLSAGRSSAVVCTTHERVYHVCYTDDPRELATSSRTEKCLERMLEILADEVHAGEEQGATNDE